VDSVTPDEPRRAPIRWHVATVRDAPTESPTARTLVLDGVSDLAALEDLAVGQHADAHRGGNARAQVPSLPSSVATRTCVSSHGSRQFCDGNATAGSSVPMSIAETPPRTCSKSKDAQLRAMRRSTCPRFGALSGASGPPAIRRLRRASTQPASERDGAGVHADNPSSAAPSALHRVRPPRICVRYTNQAQLQAGKRRLLPLPPPPPRRPTRDLRHAAKRRPRTPTGRSS
jgi:hypothetical protein